MPAAHAPCEQCRANVCTAVTCATRRLIAERPTLGHDCIGAVGAPHFVDASPRRRATCISIPAGSRRPCSTAPIWPSARGSSGPAVIDEMSATTLVPPGCAISVRRLRQPADGGRHMTRLARSRSPWRSFSNRLLSITEDMGSNADPLIVLDQHQGAQGLLGRAVRRDRASLRRHLTFRCISARCLAASRRCWPGYDVTRHERRRCVRAERSVSRRRHPYARHLDRDAGVQSTARCAPLPPM